MASKFKPNTAGNWFAEDDLAFRLNEYDEYAIEQAVQLREQGAATAAVALSIGPARVAEALKKALAMGCDRAVHVQDDESHLKDPWQIASMLAACVRKENFELVFTGMQSQDRGSGQVGQLLAEMLGWPCVTTVISFSLDGGIVTAKRELEGGAKGVVKTRLPAVITCQLGLNTPRYPTLPNIMQARKKPIDVVRVQDLPQEAALSVTEDFRAPEKKSKALLLEGDDLAVLADRLLDILKEKTTVLKD